MNEIKCKMKDCELTAYELSSFDKVRTIKDNVVIDYDRTTKWKCAANHISLTTEVVARVIEPKEPVKDTSAKRYTRKGFKGHAVSKPKPVLHDGLTNHQRALRNREMRNQRREQAMIEKYGGMEALAAKRAEWGAKADQSKGGLAAPRRFDRDPELASRAGKIGKRGKGAAS